MTIDEVTRIVDGYIISGNNSGAYEVTYGFASDLMSDVLTVTAEQALLITGLSNAQTIRTSMMSDIRVILFVRNKRVTAEMQALADENDIVLLGCGYSMFRAAGELYRAGLKALF